MTKFRATFAAPSGQHFHFVRVFDFHLFFVEWMKKSGLWHCLLKKEADGIVPWLRGLCVTNKYSQKCQRDWRYPSHSDNEQDTLLLFCPALPIFEKAGQDCIPTWLALGV